MKTSSRGDIQYTDQSLKQDLLRVQNASQARRKRDAIYCYLIAVFELVAWWAAEHCAIERVQGALRLRHIIPFDQEEPFVVIIRCTADASRGRSCHTAIGLWRLTFHK